MFLRNVILVISSVNPLSTDCCRSAQPEAIFGTGLLSRYSCSGILYCKKTVQEKKQFVVWWSSNTITCRLLYLEAISAENERVFKHRKSDNMSIQALWENNLLEVDHFTDQILSTEEQFSQKFEKHCCKPSPPQLQRLQLLSVQ